MGFFKKTRVVFFGSFILQQPWALHISLVCSITFKLWSGAY